jgi:hypothetical protein
MGEKRKEGDGIFVSDLDPDLKGEKVVKLDLLVPNLVKVKRVDSSLAP